jgi:rhodanese-related sulfurtransferase
MKFKKIILAGLASGILWSWVGSPTGILWSADTEIDAAVLRQRQPRARHEALFLTAEQVQAKRTTEDIFLVDCRTKEDYDACHIPGSIHIPLALIKARDFLQGKQVVLIDSGQGYFLVEHECIRLRQAGITASILHGGLLEWQCRYRNLTGDPAAVQNLKFINPQRLFLEKNDENWLVIDASQAETSSAAAEFTFIKHLPFSDTWLFELKQWLAESGRDEKQVSLILCNEQGIGYDALEEAMADFPLLRVFYLSGGIQAYREFCRNMLIQWQTEGTNTRVMGGDDACAKKNGVRP